MSVNLNKIILNNRVIRHEHFGGNIFRLLGDRAIYKVGSINKRTGFKLDNQGRIIERKNQINVSYTAITS